ncbi:retrovirus-related pol polyprotein from transposon TNT 1-94 [Tanacetum coccineum]
MLAPKGSTYNGRPTFANPMYLKRAQSEKLCLYEIPYDTFDLTNRFAPDREETLTLEQDTWERHTYDAFRAPTTEDMTSLLKTCLMPLALKTKNDSFIFVNELKQEMFADLQYVQSLEKEIDELEYDKDDFSNIYDLLLQECILEYVMCSYLHSLSDLDAHSELQCLYLHKSKNVNVLQKSFLNKLKMPKLKSNQMKDKVMLNNSQLKFKKIELEDHHRISSISNKTESVTTENIMIKRVYYVEGLNHNLFSVGLFYDADLEVAFQKLTCFVRDLQGNDLVIGNRGFDLYIISLQDTTSPTPICFMAKASPTQAWLWHQRLSHLNFDTISLLSKKDIVIGLPKLKYIKDQLCSSCELGKGKRSTFKSNTVPSPKGRLNLLHTDLCGPMWIESINGKKYILNRTLVKAARTMLSASKLLLFFWAEAIATAYGENLDKMKEKGDSCILVGYSTQSKGYRVYNKRTRLIVESIHINFDEIKELSKASGYDNSSPIPKLQNLSFERTEMMFEHNSSSLNIHDQNNEPSSSMLVPKFSPSTNTNAPSLQELDFLLSPLFEEYFTTGNQSMSKSSSLSDNSKQKDTQPTTNIQPTTEPITPTINAMMRKTTMIKQ